MRAKNACVTFAVFAGLTLVLLAEPARAQSQPGVVPPVPGPGGEPPRYEPTAPRIPPDFQGPKDSKQLPPRRFFDAAKAKEEASELSLLANQIPADLEKLNKKILPKDLITKLKRIEKLSKKLRSQVTQ